MRYLDIRAQKAGFETGIAHNVFIYYYGFIIKKFLKEASCTKRFC